MRITPTVDNTGEVVLGIAGWTIAPVPGAPQVFERLKAEAWDGIEQVEKRAEAVSPPPPRPTPAPRPPPQPLSTLPSLSPPSPAAPSPPRRDLRPTCHAVAPTSRAPAQGWAWWSKHKGEYSGSKMWRIIESLAGLSTARLVPKSGFHDLMMGIFCVTRTRPTRMKFSLWEGKKSDRVQVACSTEDDPAVHDPASPFYDADAEWKSAAAKGIALRNVSDPSKRDLAEKFARSGINFSLLFNANGEDVRGANPEAIEKLFEASAVTGGASGVDVTLGALRWQKDDITFKMTGPNLGRILWTPREDIGKWSGRPSQE